MATIAAETATIAAESSRSATRFRLRCVPVGRRQPRIVIKVGWAWPSTCPNLGKSLRGATCPNLALLFFTLEKTFLCVSQRKTSFSFALASVAPGSWKKASYQFFFYFEKWWHQRMLVDLKMSMNLIVVLTYKIFMNFKNAHNFLKCHEFFKYLKNIQAFEKCSWKHP